MFIITINSLCLPRSRGEKFKSNTLSFQVLPLNKKSPWGWGCRELKISDFLSQQMLHGIFGHQDLPSALKSFKQMTHHAQHMAKH